MDLLPVSNVARTASPPLTDTEKSTSTQATTSAAVVTSVAHQSLSSLSPLTIKPTFSLRKGVGFDASAESTTTRAISITTISMLTQNPLEESLLSSQIIRRPSSLRRRVDFDALMEDEARPTITREKRSYSPSNLDFSSIGEDVIPSSARDLDSPPGAPRKAIRRDQPWDDDASPSRRFSLLSSSSTTTTTVVPDEENTTATQAPGVVVLPFLLSADISSAMLGSGTTSSPSKATSNSPPRIKSIKNRDALAVKRVCESAHGNRRVSWNGKSYRLRQLGKGYHAIAYEAIRESSSSSAQADASPQKVVKAFHLYTDNMPESLKRAKQQHDRLASSECPIAPILNNPLIDKLVLQRLIPGPSLLTFSERFSSSQMEDLKKILNSFKTEYERDVAIDIQPGNLIASTDDHVILIDFEEGWDSFDGIVWLKTFFIRVFIENTARLDQGIELMRHIKAISTPIFTALMEFPPLASLRV